MCNKALGKDSSSRYSDNDNTVGMTKDFNAPFYCDVIGTSHCRSRAIACTKDEYQYLFEQWRMCESKSCKHSSNVDKLYNETMRSIKNWFKSISLFE